MMNKVIVNRTGRWEVISLDEFKKEYGISPRSTGDTFIVIQQDSQGNIYKNVFPNPACIFIDGQVKYIIYKGNMEYIVNGVRMPNAEFLEEGQVLANEEEYQDWINRYNNSHEMWIDCPDGRRIYIKHET